MSATARAGALTAFLILAGPAARETLGATSQPDSPAACRTFVQGFYDRYVRQACDGGGYSAALRRQPGSFSPELLRRLKEDDAASRKNRDEIVGLDFDPFLNAQDIAERYEVSRVVPQGGAYRAEVYGTWSGKKKGKPDVVPELRYQGGRWVFVNFHYPGTPDHPKEEDLLGILKTLREERAHPRH